VVRVYNAKGEMVNNTEYKPNNETQVEMISKYKNGNAVQTTFYDKDHNITNKIVYKYDEDGNELKESSYKPDGTLAYIYYNAYSDADAKGNWTKCTQLDADKKVMNIFGRQLAYWVQ
jgi:hypothetical protein